MTTGGLGLRERKRIAAMVRIQRAALELFDAGGFDAVTVEEIATEAEVSPSSIYRYFGTKERILVWDDVDPVAMDYIGDELGEHPPLRALRRAMVRATSEMFRNEEIVRRRVTYIFEHPAIEAEAMLMIRESESLIDEAIADATGRDPGDLEVRVVTAALMGALMAVLRHWYRSGFRDSLADELETAFDVLERGLVLDGDG